MAPEQICDPALTLDAFIFESGCGAAPKNGRDRCINARQQRGLEPTMAAIICDALTGYVYGRSSRYAYHVTHVREAQAVLHLARGGRESGGGTPAQLAPYAIAEMTGCVLTVGVDKRP